ncbi:hypothetical protein VTN96DRAFT_8385 [Rasamsonia emersonii]
MLTLVLASQLSSPQITAPLVLSTDIGISHFHGWKLGIRRVASVLQAQSIDIDFLRIKDGLRSLFLPRSFSSSPRASTRLVFARR